MSATTTSSGLKAAQKIIAALETERASLAVFHERYPAGKEAPLVWLFRELWWGGADMVRTVNTDEDVEVTFVTVGWSGNEELLSALQGSVFDMRFWESSHRGGKQVYHIPLDSWDKPAYLGDVLKYPKPDSSS